MNLEKLESDKIIKELSKKLNKIMNEKENVEHKNNIEISKLRDKCDLVEILENTVFNKNIEIKSIRNELELANAAPNSTDDERGAFRSCKLSCLNCNFKTSKEEHINIPNNSLPEHECETCDEIFQTADDQDDHECTIDIKNAIFESLSLQKLVPAKQCSPVFCKENKKEIARLHSNNCWNFTSCCQKLPRWFFGEPLRDNSGVLHLKMTDFVKNGEINWIGLKLEMIETIFLK